MNQRNIIHFGYAKVWFAFGMHAKVHVDLFMLFLSFLFLLGTKCLHGFCLNMGFIFATKEVFLIQNIMTVMLQPCNLNFELLFCNCMSELFLGRGLGGGVSMLHVENKK